MGPCASACETRRGSTVGWDVGRATFNPAFALADVIFSGRVDARGRLSAESCVEWLVDAQGESQWSARALVREKVRFAPDGTASVEEFARACLLGEDNFPTRPSAVNEEDMRDELSQYFINSSHNTYLEGDQLFSRATSEAIETALVEGCRVIELDCYDGGEKGPIVTHGGTAVRPMLFKDAIECIDAYGHAVSEYPVIVTLENHASRAVRSVMSGIIRSVFKDKLWVPPGNVEDGLRKWPSPAELKGKIIVRDKMKHKQDDKISGRRFTSFTSQKSKASKSLKGKKLHKEKRKESRKPLREHEAPTRADSVLNLASLNFTPLAENNAPAEESESDTDSDGEVDSDDVRGMVTVRNLKFQGFEKAVGARKFSCSWSENKIKKRLEREKEQNIIKFTSEHLLRTYPGGQRIFSNNYDPSPAWSAGASLVALNFQARDRYIWVNRAKFSANGGCGYVKKPAYLLNPSVPRPTTPRILRVHVYTGIGWENFKDADMFGAPDSLIKISLFGCVSDRLSQASGSKSFKTSVYSKARTGPKAQPVWNQSFDLEIREPELTVVQFQAADKDASNLEFLAHYDCAVSEIREGVRILPMLSRTNSFLYDSKSCAGVLCKFEWLADGASRAKSIAHR